MTFTMAIMCFIIALIIGSLLVAIIMPKKLVSVIMIALVTLVVCFGAGYLIQNKTAWGRRNLVDQQSNFKGLQRTVNVLNADGEVIRTYEGIIDVDNNDGGYVLFDIDGTRYMYYNCYVEIIGEY